jgi:hypothetical protein
MFSCKTPLWIAAIYVLLCGLVLVPSVSEASEFEASTAPDATAR